MVISLRFIAVLGLIFCYAASGAEPIRVGYTAGLSGPGGLQGEEQLKAFYAAADFMNSERVILGGRKIQIVPFDNKGNPQEALVILRQIIDQGIRYVTSTQSNVSHALSDAIAKYNARNPGSPVLFLNFNALDPALTEAKCSFWHFRFEPHSDMQLDVLTEHLRKQSNIRKVYLLNQDYAYGQAVSRTAREMLTRKRPDIQIVADDLIPFGKVKDFAPYVAKIHASGADAVLTGNWGTDLSLLIKASKQAGLKAAYFTLLGAYFGHSAAIGADGADRVKSISSWHINAADPVWEQRILTAQAKYKTRSDLAFIPPIRVLDMLGTALNQVGSEDTLRVAFALEGMRYAGPSGESMMRSDDHQLLAPLFVVGFMKAGKIPAKHDVEGTGYGWRTETLVTSGALHVPIRCQMDRPPKPAGP